jgi:hypothetical protein
MHHRTSPGGVHPLHCLAPPRCLTLFPCCRLVDSEQTKCPTCRNKLSATAPIRNLVAEETIGSLPCACPNRDCKEALTRRMLALHTKVLLLQLIPWQSLVFVLFHFTLLTLFLGSDNVYLALYCAILQGECQERVVACKFSRLGCDWMGVAHSMRSHAKKCKFLTLSGDALLEALATADSTTAAAKAEEKRILQQEAAVLTQLSRRCRNLVVRDVKLGSDPCHSRHCRSTHFSSGRFKASL